MSVARPRPPLNDLEVRVLAGIASGATNEEIAASLNYSRSYIKDVVVSARTRLGARDRAHAAALAVALGVVRVTTGDEPSFTPRSVETSDPLDAVGTARP